MRATCCRCKTMQYVKKAAGSRKEIMESLSMHPLRARCPVIATNFRSRVLDKVLLFFLSNIVTNQCRIY